MSRIAGRNGGSGVGPVRRPETEAACAAVRLGIELLAPPAGRNDVAVKEGRELVTEMDVAVEGAIRQILTELHPVVGEEDGGEAPDDGSPYWLVDPLCGTRNYAYGIPLYAVNVALVELGHVTVAVTGLPVTREVHFAELGRGAWSSDGRRLTTRDDPLLVVVEDGHASGSRRRLAARYAAAVIEADQWDVRSLGTTACLPFLAAGRISAYVDFWVSSVHSAAGTLLVTEAGGVISDVTGAPWSIHSDSLLAAATGQLHDQLAVMAASPDRRTRPASSDSTSTKRS